MIDRQFTQQSWDELVAFMTFLYGIGWESLFLCNSLERLIRWTFDSDLQPHHCGYQAFDKAVFPLFGVFEFSFCDVKYSSFAESYKKCIYILTRRNLPTKVRILFTIFLSRISQFALNRVSEIDVRNKQMYRHLTTKRSTSLFFTKLSGVRGWVSLALDFYLCGHYKKAFIVLEYAKSVSFLSDSIISSVSKIEVTQDIVHLYHLEEYISQLRRLVCNSKFKQTCFCVNNIHTYDYLLQWLPQQNFIQLPIEVLIHYLRFACSHHLQDIFQRQQCLHDLTLITETAISDGLLPNVCSLHLFHAYQIVYDTDYFRTDL